MITIRMMEKTKWKPFFSVYCVLYVCILNLKKNLGTVLGITHYKKNEYKICWLRDIECSISATPMLSASDTVQQQKWFKNDQMLKSFKGVSILLEPKKSVKSVHSPLLAR